MVSVTQDPGKSLSQGVTTLVLDFVALYVGFCLTGVFRRERKRRFPSRMSLGFSAAETVLVAQSSAAVLVGSLFLLYGITPVPLLWEQDTMKSRIILGYVCLYSVCISSFPQHLFLGNGGGCQTCYRDRGSWKFKKKVNV